MFAGPSLALPRVLQQVTVVGLVGDSWCMTSVAWLGDCKQGGSGAEQQPTSCMVMHVLPPPLPSEPSTTAWSSLFLFPPPSLNNPWNQELA
ncbi:hypothetical protein HaLaN_04448 [Haematococcus lacustris]|uniref:Uncharacterized protein n=1 Tax=Haematococcus lacustris TaxID=44745 RepID=A0A699YJ98_HAELA|nr:hypothetical protein HaLaN_04448 [Haematococcus lacustris]